MADFAFQIEAPDAEWAELVRSRVQRALGERGSIQLGRPGERLENAPAAPGYVVTGMAVCDEPSDEMRNVIRSALAGYEFEERVMPGGVPQFVVRPAAR